MGTNAGPSQPNGPDALHAPWRMSYMEMLSAREKGERARAAATGDGSGGDRGASAGNAAPPGAPAGPPTPVPGKNTSFLRAYWLTPSDDHANHVIVRTGEEPMGSGGLILLNKYPYAGGHLLVCLGDGRPRLTDYSPAQRAELWSLVDLAVAIAERALEPQGVNVGINQGMAAGAGEPGHLHAHVIPRWFGDVNFITTVGQVRVIPNSLDDMARRYREVWEAMR